MMTEEEIRTFVDRATEIAGDSVTVTEAIVRRWLADQEEIREQATRQVYDDLGVPR